ncbi:MAG: undecaprenyl-diphosphate phosphatase [Candidatus Izemoplasmatales bacterium]|jgi:undecaprenyl-diphosphatase
MILNTTFDFLELLKYFILGMIQGLTEVLPISSSGHVMLFKLLLDLQADEGLLFMILVNSGSLVVFLFVYRKDLREMIVGFFRYIFYPKMRTIDRQQFLFVLKLGIATVPAALTGFLLSNLIDQGLILYGGLFSGIGLLLTATVLLFVSQRRFLSGHKEISYKDAFLVGIVQAITPLPGVSRSGMTTVAALGNDVHIDSAIRFSFLLYIPLSIGSLGILVAKIFTTGFETLGTQYYIYYIVAFFASVIFTAVGFLIIKPIFKTGKLRYFSLYCFGAGALSILLFLFK